MTQSQALDILKTGANVFLTGEPGAGKTYVVNQYIAWLEAAGLKVAVTASTGIAATHLGGMTIHSWSGIGVRDTLTRADLDQIMTKEKIVKRIQQTHVLIIDEISMLDGKVLDMVEVVCKTARQREEAFGGLQVVLVGDFFQLPPVTRQGEVLRYAFASHAWDKLRPLVCYLSEQWRQEDELLLALLSSIRRGQIEDDHFTLLNEQTEIAYPDVEPTRLYTHNADVDAVNLQKLQALTTRSKVYTMSGRGSKVMVESLMRNCLSPQSLTLKPEAMVMFTKNNFEAGYVNGTLGKVVDFDTDTGEPVVATADGRRLTVSSVSWDVIEDGKIRASIEQLPLRLAWAITIHKSQGMSLDAAEVDLSKAFVFGQGYVALSRVRSLAGLKVLGMHPNALQVDPQVTKRDEVFRQQSDDAETTFGELTGEDISTIHEQFVVGCGGKIPSPDAVAAGKVPAERILKRSTYEETLALIEAGKSIAVIAKERSVQVGTVISHIETLAIEKKLNREYIENISIDFGVTQKAKQEILSAIETHGSEKLRPLHEATGEQYSYELIRLIRLLEVI